MATQKLSGIASVRKAMRETPECECGSTKPAVVTRMEWRKVWGVEKKVVVGYCVDCQPITIETNNIDFEALRAQYE